LREVTCASLLLRLNVVAFLLRDAAGCIVCINTRIADVPVVKRLNNPVKPFEQPAAKACMSHANLGVVQ
jgi:hypothetical protein